MHVTRVLRLLLSKLGLFKSGSANPGRGRGEMCALHAFESWLYMHSRHNFVTLLSLVTITFELDLIAKILMHMGFEVGA